MSAFLGPIHKWLYGKIKFQEELVQTLLEMAEKEGLQEGLKDSVHQKCGMLETGELEEIIDGSNIHGWLQERVTIVEKRLAYTVTSLVERKADIMEKLQEIAFACGTRYQADAAFSLQETYQFLDTLWLNGMPCDRVNEIVQQEEGFIVWKQSRDIHEVYWQEVGGDIKNFYQIRKSLIQGILKDTSIVYEELGEDVFQLRKNL